MSWLKLRRLRRGLSTGAILVVTVSVAAGSASAGTSTNVAHFTVDDTSVDEVTTAFCGFEVVTRFQATITDVIQESPTRFHEVFVGPATYTWTNAATGMTVTAQNTFTSMVSVVSTDSSTRFVLRGSGLNYLVKSVDGVITSAGSFSLGVDFGFDESGVPVSVDVFGHAFTPSLLHTYPILCVLLGAKDTDRDYLPDSQGIRTEKAFRTDPTNPDTDGDGYLDGIEVANETDPRRAASHPQSAIGDIDKDDDLLDDGAEVLIFHTDPTNPDTDGDGFLDGEEAFFGTDPTRARDHP